MCQQIKVYCKNGWPEKHKLPGAVKPYYPVHVEISVENGLLLRKQRAELLVASPFPDIPWQKVATDLFEYKRENYLLVVDY